jgi:hypothetical protein
MKTSMSMSRNKIRSRALPGKGRGVKAGSRVGVLAGVGIEGGV